MSQVIIEFGRANAGQPGRGNDASVNDPFPQIEELTSSGTSSATTIEAFAHDVATVINNGTDDIWVSFAASPTATTGSGVFVPANSVRDFGPIGLGMKAAVINDS